MSLRELGAFYITHMNAWLQHGAREFSQLAYDLELISKNIEKRIGNEMSVEFCVLARCAAEAKHRDGESIAIKWLQIVSGQG